jgi:hypothetical protein
VGVTFVVKFLPLNCSNDSHKKPEKQKNLGGTPNSAAPYEPKKIS